MHLKSLEVDHPNCNHYRKMVALRVVTITVLRAEKPLGLEKVPDPCALSVTETHALSHELTVIHRAHTSTG